MAGLALVRQLPSSANPTMPASGGPAQNDVIEGELLPWLQLVGASPPSRDGHQQRRALAASAQQHQAQSSSTLWCYGWPLEATTAIPVISEMPDADKVTPAGPGSAHIHPCLASHTQNPPSQDSDATGQSPSTDRLLRAGGGAQIRLCVHRASHRIPHRPLAF